ncbi:MAG: SRPBCC family protein [Gemmatimonadota bacterium]
MTSTQELHMTSTDRIEKKIQLRAPRAKVWRALTDATEFAVWFKAKLDGSFAVGRTVKGNITHPGYEHLKIEMIIERMDAEDAFSYRWHPYPIDPKVDYSVEPTTLVEFRLQEQDGGTLLTVVESGFDTIPAGRRDEAFRMNDKGWAGQLENIKRHVAG